MAAEESLPEAVGIDKKIAPRARHIIDDVDHALRTKYRRTAAHGIHGRDEARIDDRDSTVGGSALKILGSRDTDQVESENKIGIAGIDLGGRFDWARAQKKMGDHRSPFLGGASLIERHDRQTVDPGGGGEQRINRHNTGATDARA